MTQHPDPAINALIASSDAEWAKLEEMVVVNRAEGVVGSARIEELAAAQLAAKRRMFAAKGLLTKARRSGDADRIAAARQRVEEAERELFAISDAGIAEQQAILGHQLDEYGRAMAQVGRHWRASDAVVHALTTRPPGSSETAGGEPS